MGLLGTGLKWGLKLGSKYLTKSGGKKIVKWLGKQALEYGAYELGDWLLGKVLGEDEEDKQVENGESESMGATSEGAGSGAGGSDDSSDESSDEEELQLSIEDEGRINDHENELELAKKLSDYNSSLSDYFKDSDAAIQESEVIGKASPERITIGDLVKSDNELLKNIVAQVAIQNKHIAEKEHLQHEIAKKAVKQEQKLVIKKTDENRRILNERDKIEYQSEEEGDKSTSTASVGFKDQNAQVQSQEQESEGGSFVGAAVGLGVAASDWMDDHPVTSTMVGGLVGGVPGLLTSAAYNVAQTEIRSYDKSQDLYEGITPGESFEHFSKEYDKYKNSKAKSDSSEHQLIPYLSHAALPGNSGKVLKEHPELAGYITPYNYKNWLNNRYLKNRQYPPQPTQAFNEFVESMKRSKSYADTHINPDGTLNPAPWYRTNEQLNPNFSVTPENSPSMSTDVRVAPNKEYNDPLVNNVAKNYDPEKKSSVSMNQSNSESTKNISVTTNNRLIINRTNNQSEIIINNRDPRITRL